MADKVSSLGHLLCNRPSRSSDHQLKHVTCYDQLSSALAAQEKALQRFAARKKSIDQGAASPVGSQGQPRVLDRKEDDTKLDDQGAQDWASQQVRARAFWEFICARLLQHTIAH